VSRFLEIQAAHDGEVDSTAQVDHISARLVRNVARIATTPSLTTLTVLVISV
jgi:hypothetical protein